MHSFSPRSYVCHLLRKRHCWKPRGGIVQLPYSCSAVFAPLPQSEGSCDSLVQCGRADKLGKCHPASYALGDGRELRRGWVNFWNLESRTKELLRYSQLFALSGPLTMGMGRLSGSLNCQGMPSRRHRAARLQRTAMRDTSGTWGIGVAH